MNCLTHSGLFKSLWTRPIYRAGNLYTWGVHSLGCGINQDSQGDQLRPRRIDAFNGNVAKVYPSEYFTAVITDNGDLYTFGHNKYGQLGLGNTEEHQTPQLVRFFRDKGLKVTDVALGSNHAVALACTNRLRYQLTLMEMFILGEMQTTHFWTNYKAKLVDQEIQYNKFILYIPI